MFSNKNELKNFLKSYSVIQLRLNYLYQYSPDSLNEIFQCEKLLNNISDIIHLIDDDLLCLILDYKYICSKGLSEIATILNYSEKYVIKLHSRAINVLFDIVSCEVR